MEAERRRAEADLTAEMARLLLAGTGLEDALALIGRPLALVFSLPWAAIELADIGGDLRRRAIPLQAGTRRIGTLLVPAQLPARLHARLRERVVPALSAILGIALDRERLVAEAVQTEGLRRSEAVKTAGSAGLVSHDLRSPVTAMIAAGSAVRDPELSEAERDELGRLVVDEGARLAKLIEQIFLTCPSSRRTRPRRAWRNARSRR